MVSPGASVSEGQPVMELETDKAVVEVPSSISGTVKDVLVKQGEKIKVGQVIFTVDNGSGNGTRKPLPAKPEVTKPTAEAQPEPAPQSAAPELQAAPSAATSTAAIVPSESTDVAEFKLPELGENVHQGDLVRLMVAPGAHVAEGQPVIELETEKAVVEVPSSLT